MRPRFGQLTQLVEQPIENPRVHQFDSAIALNVAR